MSKGKKTDAWMPLYIGDYLADTSRLTTEQHGAYVLILMDYWRNGPPPDDDEVLASIAKLGAQQWRKHSPIIRRFFTPQDGMLIQKRVEQERQKASGVSDKRREAGRQGAAKKWGKQDGSTDGEDMANAMANASDLPVANGWQTDRQSQSQSHSPTFDEGQGVSPSGLAPQSEPARVVFALKPFGIMGSSSHPMLRTLCEAGATVEEFTSAAPSAKGKDDPFAYVVGTVKRRREEAARAASGLHKGAMPQRPPTQREADALTAGYMTGAVPMPSAQPRPQADNPETIDVESRFIAP